MNVVWRELSRFLEDSNEMVIGGEELFGLKFFVGLVCFGFLFCFLRFMVNEVFNLYFRFKLAFFFVDFVFLEK